MASVNGAAMRRWFDALPPEDREAWLDAAEVGEIIPDDLVQTLPPERRPPDQPASSGDWATRTAAWWILYGVPNEPVSRVWMTPELRDFLLGELARLRGSGVS